jgi:hypothetical protein
VTHRNVERFIGRLVIDAAMRSRFEEAPAAVLEELRRQGYDLSPVELDALASTDVAAIREFAGVVGRRLSQAQDAKKG